VQAQQAFGGETVDVEKVIAVLDDLQMATTVENVNESVSELPQSLEVTNNVLNMTLDFLMDDLVVNSENPVPLNLVSLLVS
jgi:molecular chaperone GrpE (heat shock protein)